MRKWEDIVKEKMEDPKGALPESVFDEFRARREASASAPKHFPLVWALVPAAAAGLAAVLLLRGPSEPDDSIQIVRRPVAPVAVVEDTLEIQEPLISVPLAFHTTTPKKVVSSSDPRQEVVNPDKSTASEDVTLGPEDERTDAPETSYPDTLKPFSKQVTKDMTESSVPVTIKTGTATGAIVGGGLLAALITPLTSSGTLENPAFSGQGGYLYDNNFGSGTDPLEGTYKHYLPLKFGLSLAMPLTERLRVSSGIKYSLYRSDFVIPSYGKIKQRVNYLGIPLRLDWKLASNKWMDVYLGGGVEGEFCVGAALDGKKLERDGFCFSFLGAGGIQFNISRAIALYVEPELSWSVPSQNRVLQTYRTDNPFGFSVVTGLRFNLAP